MELGTQHSRDRGERAVDVRSGWRKLSPFPAVPLARWLGLDGSCAAVVERVLGVRTYVDSGAQILAD